MQNSKNMTDGKWYKPYEEILNRIRVGKMNKDDIAQLDLY